MSFEAIVWILIVIIVIALIFGMVFFLLAFDEMRQSKTNPIDVCKSLNPWVLPEYIAHGVLTLLLVVNGEWVATLFNLGLIAYHVRRLTSSNALNFAIYDATCILDYNVSKFCNMECTIKLLFYMMSFFYYLYSMMFALLA